MDRPELDKPMTPERARGRDGRVPGEGVGQRRKTLLVAGILLLVLAVGLASLGVAIGHGAFTGRHGQDRGGAGDVFRPTGVLGDIDGDRKLSKSERAALQTTQRTYEQLDKTAFAGAGGDSTNDLKPPRHERGGGATVTEGLLTPGGDAWWQMVTSLAPELRLYQGPAPSGAGWFAVTDQRATNPLEPSRNAYSAVFVAFPDLDAASRWVASLARVGATQSARVTYRGGLVTFTPTWVDPVREAYRAQVPDLSKTKVTTAIWNWSIGPWAQVRGQDTGHAAEFIQAWRNLGFTDSATFQASSPTPSGPWVGKVSGFDAANVDVSSAAMQINRMSISCELSEEGCTKDTPGETLLYQMYLRQGGGRPGTPAASHRGAYAGVDDWDNDAAPADVDIYVGMSPSFGGSAGGTGSAYHPPMGKLTLWVQGSTMTVMPVFGLPRPPDTNPGTNPDINPGTSPGTSSPGERPGKGTRPLPAQNSPGPRAKKGSPVAPYPTPASPTPSGPTRRLAPHRLAPRRECLLGSNGQ